MNTPIVTATETVEGAAGAAVERAEDLRTLAAYWPQFSAQELCRLHFLVYRRRAGRLRVPTPVSAEVETLCAALLRQTGPPNAAGLPPLWAAWAAQQRAGQSAVAGHAQE